MQAGYPARAMAQPTREEAWQLVCEWTESDSLRKHMLGVETAMRAYAREWDEDEELWGVTGLLHDLDYERYPDLDRHGHPRKALELFEERGYPPELIEAVAGPRDLPGRAARDAHGEDAVRRGRAVRLHRRLRLRAARRHPRA